ncbi:MAG: hypothetical protein R3E01_06780 [Pirellulaceae bacterium]|nr:hypothetical protein [Planctomycetales bacterium]
MKTTAPDLSETWASLSLVELPTLDEVDREMAVYHRNRSRQFRGAVIVTGFALVAVSSYTCTVMTNQAVKLATLQSELTQYRESQQEKLDQLSSEIARHEQCYTIAIREWNAVQQQLAILQDFRRKDLGDEKTESLTTEEVQCKTIEDSLAATEESHLHETNSWAPLRPPSSFMDIDKLNQLDDVRFLSGPGNIFPKESSTPRKAGEETPLPPLRHKINSIRGVNLLEP